MKRQFLSIILSVTLVASAIAGAMSVSIKSANADEESNDLYFNEFIAYVQDLDQYQNLSTADRNAVDNILSSAASYIENDTAQVLIMRYGVAFSLLIIDASVGQSLISGGYYQSDRQYWYYQDTSYYGYCRCYGFIYANFDSLVYNTSPGSFVGSPRWRVVNIASPLSYQEAWFSPYEINTYECYGSQDILTNQSYNGFTFSKNLYAGDRPETIEHYELIKFKLGDIDYLTVSNQYLLSSDIWATHIIFRIETEGDVHEYYDSDIIKIPNGTVFIDYQFPTGTEDIFAVNISSLGWSNITYSDFYQVVANDNDVDVYAIADNVPYSLVPEAQETPSNAEAWSIFNEYVTNYNQTHVIPEQLGDWLFETNGSKLFPCSVQVPTHIWYDKFQTTAAPDNHIWRWGGSLIQEEGFQYSLYDVVIVGESDSGYGIRYFYDDTLNPSYNYIDEMLFANLIDSFDVVIIVPESEGILYELPGVDVGPIGYTGSSSSGVVYTDDPLVGNTLQGFCILTERAIAKQQLWNFNDGIAKLYQLEVDYIDSEDKWKDSFLLWSASMFEMMNSLDGRLNTINTTLLSISSLVDSIKTAVEHIAEDPDPDNVSPWYLSLWNFVKQFNPSNDQISQGIDALEDNLDDIPLLPALTPVPALPTLGG